MYMQLMQLYLHETFLITLHVGLISNFLHVSLYQNTTYIAIQTFVREFNTLILLLLLLGSSDG